MCFREIEMSSCFVYWKRMEGISWVVLVVKEEEEGFNEDFSV